MSWSEIYRAKRKRADEALAIVKNGDQIFHGGNSAMPGALIRALAARQHELRDVTITHMLLLGDYPLAAAGSAASFRHKSLFVGHADRQAVADGQSDYIPVHLHQIPRLFHDRIIDLDVALIMVSPPDEHGFMSFGVEALTTRAACDTARHVIVQVNPQMPRLLGNAFIHVSRVHAIVEQEEPLVLAPPRSFGEVERRIGANVRSLITDGATLQMGIGGIPDAVLASLDGLRDLGIHTEMISDGAMRAIEAGIITGARKTLHPGKVILTFALGSPDLYAFLDNNAMVEAHPADYVNDPAIIAKNDKMIAINSALAVDLTGQICAESLGRSIYSGFGGQLDFIRGAAASRGGMPIIALPSTAKNGAISRIVPTLPNGSGVVTTRADVHYVVTEHGIAHLFGRSLRDRAKALIAIADPKFRDELART